MERDDVHELIAAYAIGALEPDEEARYEDHLARCATCREELTSFRDTAGFLAYGAQPVDPPPGLRERILEQARAERPNVVPLRPRRPNVMWASAAALAACAAVALAIWGASLSSQLGEERDTRAAEERALAVALDPEADRFRLEGAEGTLAVADDGQAALVLTDLEPPPEGTVYTAWVSADGKQMFPAGTFAAEERQNVVRLTRPVPAGGLVAVTVEKDENAQSPTADPIIVVEAT